jgi:hypothetical protein
VDPTGEIIWIPIGIGVWAAGMLTLLEAHNNFQQAQNLLALPAAGWGPAQQAQVNALIAQGNARLQWGERVGWAGIGIAALGPAALPVMRLIGWGGLFGAGGIRLAILLQRRAAILARLGNINLIIARAGPAVNPIILARQIQLRNQLIGVNAQIFNQNVILDIVRGMMRDIIRGMFPR